MKHIYFYDCPRTGGTSFKHWSRRAAGLKRVYFGGSQIWHHVPFSPRDKVRELAPKGSEFYTLTLLRDPVEHTASLYSKIRVHKHSYREKLKGLSFQNWIYGRFEADRKTAPDPWGFSMVRFYDPETGDLNRAIENIESIDFVGFTDRLDKDLNLFLDQIGSNLKYDRSRKNAVRRAYHISPKDRAHILRIRSDDLILVNHFREKRGLKPYA